MVYVHPIVLPVATYHQTSAAASSDSPLDFAKCPSENQGGFVQISLPATKGVVLNSHYNALMLIMHKSTPHLFCIPMCDVFLAGKPFF